MARKHEQQIPNTPDWGRLTSLDDGIYRRAEDLPRNQGLPIRIRWAGGLLRDRRVAWSQDGAWYIYDGTRMKSRVLDRIAGTVACITQVRTQIAEHNAYVTSADYRTIRYRLGGFEGDALLDDSQDSLEVAVEDANNPEALRERVRTSEALRTELGLDTPGSATGAQLTNWLEAGEVLTRSREEK